MSVMKIKKKVFIKHWVRGKCSTVALVHRVILKTEATANKIRIKNIV